jgi:hypothetical protein
MNLAARATVRIPMERVDEIHDPIYAWEAIEDVLSTDEDNRLYFLLKPHIKKMNEILGDISTRYDDDSIDETLVKNMIEGSSGGL